MKATTATSSATTVPTVTQRAVRLWPTILPRRSSPCFSSAALDFVGMPLSRVSPQELQNLAPGLHCAPQRGQYTAGTLADTTSASMLASLTGSRCPARRSP